MGWLLDLLAPENLLALLGVVATVGVLSYERLFPGRKRIGFRVQMDTVIDDGSRDEGPLHQRLRILESQTDLSGLSGASLVLLRIENDGFRGIDAQDYINSPAADHGLTATFPGRTVRDVAVTEPSHLSLLRYLPRGSNEESPGLVWSGSEVSIPRVPLNRGDHFKLLVLLTGPGGEKPAEVDGRLKEGKVRNNERFRRPTNRMLGLILSLFLVTVAQPFFFSHFQEKPLPAGCAGGNLSVVGSTAFEPVMTRLAGAYRENCKSAPKITVDAHGSGAGISTLLDRGSAAGNGFAPYLALSDGPAQSRNPRLKGRLVAVSVFALVVNKDVRLTDIRRADLQKLYTGDITDWRDLRAASGTPGPHLRVTLVGRDGDSGSRNVFEERLLGGTTEPPRTSSADDCGTRFREYKGITRCEQSSTDRLLKTVAATPGAIGYADLHTAQEYAAKGKLQLLGLDGKQPSTDAVRTSGYPFWEPEYAYTYGTPPDNSLTSKFLDSMNSDTGQNVMERNGHLPCTVPDNRDACDQARQEDR
ncbi:PstS family phosphate ABC transporter substrate-binding protein [Streptomyces sp. TS71-3]|uniref:PstS family phosphate ABC transporter substrate-binding protein n=1 Tax=Streptomyces sp. TS71-3 TaxID=2733862 RepID=UPI001B2784F0|nr:substrate-binding domain-containing protein [Streptomyces sp. TS71-3]GHJ34524.1 phosphate-binding protein [Streptomyces sp. TS71-3]